MIRSEQYPLALTALQRLIVHAKAQAYEAGENKLAELLNDVELLPEYFADQRDRTGEFETRFPTHMAFSPDGRTLAIGSLDSTISLWDIPFWRIAGK